MSWHSWGVLPTQQNPGGNQGDLEGPTMLFPPLPLFPPPSLTGLLILPTHQVCPASWEHMEHSRTLWNTLSQDPTPYSELPV